jgi:acetolactate synthase I/II/III large subunit
MTETLISNGMTTIYGLPGLHNDPLFDGFHPRVAAGRLSVVHTRHEQTSAYMALGAALATNEPQAFAVVPGPGFLNASAALLSAYAMNAPVIGIVGQIPQVDIDRGFGHLHEIRDQLGLASHIAKYTACDHQRCHREHPIRCPTPSRHRMRDGRVGAARHSRTQCPRRGGPSAARC